MVEALMVATRVVAMTCQVVVVVAVMVGDGSGAGVAAVADMLFFLVQVCLLPSLSCGLRLTLFGCELFGVE